MQGIVTLTLALIIQFPIRSVQAESFVRPFASASRFLQNRPESFILLDNTKVWYSQDFIRNDPFLRRWPKFFFSRRLSSEQVARLDQLGTVHQVEPEELVRFGLIRVEAPKINHDQAQGAGHVPGTAPEPLGDIGAARQAEQRDRQIAQTGHHLRPGRGAHLRAVFVEGHVAHPVEPILNPPMQGS